MLGRGPFSTVPIEAPAFDTPDVGAQYLVTNGSGPLYVVRNRSTSALPNLATQGEPV